MKTTSEPSYNDSDFRRKGKEGFTTPYQWYYPYHRSSDVFLPIVKTTDNATNNDIIWTENLVDINLPPSNGYFIGTVNSVLRFYPGTVWPQQYDMYDVRHQSWFLQAASSKHDIALVIDRSGSLYGRPLKTIKGIARLIIKLIPANYRFNVFLFNNETVPLKECYGMEPLPANDSVKSAMLVELDRIEAAQPGLFNEALLNLEMSFFAKSDRDKTCKKMIILFTDGKIDFDLKKVQETLKRLNLKLLVLNFSSPSSFGPNQNLREMTCQVGGRYVFVNRIGDYFKVADMFFDTVCSRSVSNIEAVSPRWSNPIVTFYNKKSMIVSYPLFNKTGTENILQGVLGTEILLDEFVSDFSLEAGGLAYGIISLPNGKVINHPRLISADIVPTLAQVSVESDEILYPSEIMESSPITKIQFPVIEETIDGTIGRLKFQLVVPENDAYNVSINKIKKEIETADEIIYDNYGETLFIRPIEKTLHPFNFKEERVSMFAFEACGEGWLKTETLRRNCPDHKKYVLPVVRDVVVTRTTVSSWKKLEDANKQTFSRGNFLLTRNGVLWSNLSYYRNAVPNKVPEYLEFSADPNKFPPGTLLVTRPFKNSMHLSKSININYEEEYTVARGDSQSNQSNQSNRIVVSVMGVALKYPRFSAVIDKLQGEFSLDNENYQLYLLDHKGYIVHSSLSNEVPFFGDVNSALFDILVKHGYFIKKTFKDCLCREEVTFKSEGQRLSLFIVQLIAKFISSAVAVAVSSLSLIREAYSFIMPETKMAEQCCRTIYAYERNFTVSNYRGDEYNFCPRDKETHCTERYAVQHVPNTNLLLVLVIKRDNPNCNCKQVPQSRLGPVVRVSDCDDDLRGSEGSLNEDLCYDDVTFGDDDVMLGGLSDDETCDGTIPKPTF